MNIFSLDAFHYLVKPVSARDVAETFRRFDELSPRRLRHDLRIRLSRASGAGKKRLLCRKIGTCLKRKRNNYASGTTKTRALALLTFEAKKFIK